VGTNALFVATHVGQKGVAIGHLFTYVPSTMFNNVDGDKEEKFTM
jgi:hypothetical protein